MIILPSNPDVRSFPSIHSIFLTQLEWPDRVCNSLSMFRRSHSFTVLSSEHVANRRLSMNLQPSNTVGYTTSRARQERGGAMRHGERTEQCTAVRGITKKNEKFCNRFLEESEMTPFSAEWPWQATNNKDEKYKPPRPKQFKLDEQNEFDRCVDEQFTITRNKRCLFWIKYRRRGEFE